MATARDQLLQLAPRNQRIDKLAAAILGMTAVRASAARGKTTVTVPLGEVTAATGMQLVELQSSAAMLETLHGIRLRCRDANVDGGIVWIFFPSRWEVTIDWG
jgi:hypothetical protein